MKKAMKTWNEVRGDEAQGDEARRSEARGSEARGDGAPEIEIPEKGVSEKGTSEKGTSEKGTSKKRPGVGESPADGIWVKAKDLAEMLDVSVQRIGQLKKDGVFEQLKRPEGMRYNAREAVRAYVRFIKKGESGKSKSGKALFEEEKVEAEAQLKQTKAKIAELQLKELLGQMHRAEDVRDMTSDLIFAIRSSLTALPGRLATQIVAVGTPAEASDLIRREVLQVMAELAAYEYDPDAYAERVRARAGLQTSDADEEPDAEDG